VKVKIVVKTLLGVWAIVGAPFLFGMSVQVILLLCPRGERLPLDLSPKWIWCIAFALSTISGTWAVYKCLDGKRFILRLATPTLYLALLFPLLFYVALQIAFANGDSL
jgi:hypothetical protein